MLLACAANLDGAFLYDIATAYELEAYGAKDGSSGTSGENEQCFYADSGASAHCCNDHSLFVKFYADAPKTKIRVANGTTKDVTAIGDIQIHVKDVHGESHCITLYGVLYVPDIPVNLISIKRLWKDNKIKAKFRDNLELKDLDGNKFIFSIDQKHYKINYHAKAPKSAYGLSVDIDTRTGVDHVFSTMDVSSNTLHAILGHPHPSKVAMLRERATGLPNVAGQIDKRRFPPEVCDACERGGSRKPSFHRRMPQHKFTGFGHRVQSDLCGPFPRSVAAGYLYVLCFVDSATGYSVNYYLNSKHADEVKECFQKYITKYTKYFATGKVEEWFTDGGGEFTSKDLTEFCEEFAIKRGYSTPWSPPQNGKAERLWGILLRGTRIALAHCGLPEAFWAYAMEDALWLHNHMPSRSNAGHKSPFELVFGAKPDFSRKRVFGCKCYFHLSDYDYQKYSISKVGPTAVEAINLGTDPERRAYLVYIPQFNRITSAYKPVFAQTRFLRFTSTGSIAQDDAELDDPDTEQITRRQHHAPPTTRDYTDTGDVQNGAARNGVHADDYRPADDAAHGEPSTAAQRGAWSDNHCEISNCDFPKGHSGPHSRETNVNNPVGNPHQGTRSHGAFYVHTDNGGLEREAETWVCQVNHIRFLYDDLSNSESWILNVNEFGAIPIPSSYEAACASKHAAKWHEAMRKEVEDLMLHGTWTDAFKIPDGRKATKGKWVYTVKYMKDGTVDRFKARYVVCGYSQIQGYDYDRSFSATLRGTSFRTLLAVAAQYGLTLEHFDVTNAFTQAPIDDVDIFVSPPKGFETYDANGNVKPLKLIKALYGTKQASRLWQKKLREWLVENGFEQSVTEPCMFTKIDGQGRRIIVAVYVDDLIVAHSNQMVLESFSKQFLKDFRAKHLGPLDWFLGIAIERPCKGVYEVHQLKYINDLLAKFVPGHDHLHIFRDVPISPERFAKLVGAVDDAERERMRLRPYLQLIGSLLYLGVMTRPDIMVYMCVLCKYMSNPSEDCYEAAIELLLYVGKTKDLKMTYRQNGTKYRSIFNSSKACEQIRINGGLHAFSDSSWGKAFPLAGYGVFMADGLIAFSSKLLKIVADSSCEAEYAASSLCAKELKFVRGLLEDMGHPVTGSIVMGVDNTAAIDTAVDVGVTKRNKHYERALHYIREEVACLRVFLVFVGTHLQMADIFTKALAKAPLAVMMKYLYGKIGD